MLSHPDVWNDGDVLALIEAACARGTSCSSSGRPFDCARLLAPCSIDDFLAAHWERHPFVRRGCAHHHDDLLLASQAEALIVTAPEEDEASLKGTFGVISDEGVDHYYPLERTDSHLRSNEKIHRALADGYTVVTNALNHRHAGVAALCADVEQRLQQRVGCNLYLSPAAQQGFSVHQDHHDTYLIQLSGRKQWSIWPAERPQPTTVVNGEAPPTGPPAASVELTAGDLLYIPRGWWHGGVTDATEGSLHVTVGTPALRWGDLMTAAIREWAEHDVRLRRSLPIAPAGRASLEALSDELSEQADELLADFAGLASNPDARTASVQRALVQRFKSATPSFRPRVDATLRLHEISTLSTVERRPGLDPQLTDTSDGCRLVFLGGALDGPASARAALALVASRRHFRVGDLPGLSPDVQVALIKELILDGLLQVVDAS